MKLFFAKITTAIFAAFCFFCLVQSFACTSKTVRLSTYTMTLDYSDDTLSGNMNVEYYNNSSDIINCVCFNLYPNAYREGAKFPAVGKNYYDTCVVSGSYGKITIESAGEGGQDAQFEIIGDDENILSVKLNSPLTPDKKCDISIKFTTILQHNTARLGVNAQSVNLANFYPIACVYENGAFIERPFCCIGDPFYSDFSNYYVTITVPSVYTVACSGKPVKCIPDGEKSTYSYELASARDFAFALSENFNVLSAKCGYTTINYYYVEDENAESSLKEAVNALSFFDEYLAPFAYPVYSVVQTDFYCGGMEFPALSYVSGQIAIDYPQYLYAIVHETAHQWFPITTGNDEYESGYFDEGLAEFLSYKFYSRADENIGKDLLSGAEKAYGNYVKVQNALGKEADTVMRKSLRDFESEFEYINIAYSKGLMLFCQLESEAGDNYFQKILVNFLKNNKFSRVNENHFIAQFGSKKNRLKGVFDCYIYGKALLCLQNPR